MDDSRLYSDNPCGRDLLRPADNPREPDRLLRTAEAAKRLSVSRQYFYDNEHKLPFAFRLPGGGPLRVSERGLEEWLERKLSEATRG